MRYLISAAILTFLLGCANKPFDPLPRAQEKIRQAQAAKADVYAKQDYERAVELVGKAQEDIFNYRFPDAERACLEAAAWAELASVKTKVLQSTASISQGETDLKILAKAISESFDDGSSTPDTTPLSKNNPYKDAIEGNRTAEKTR